MAETYLDKAHATVEYRPNENIVSAEMTEYAEGDKYREYMNTVIDAVEDTQCSNVLADTRDHPAIDQEDQEWSQKTWGPNAEAAGVDHVAVVAPESIVSKMSIESVTEGADDDIERQWFEEYEDAVSWLQSN